VLSVIFNTSFPSDAFHFTQYRVLGSRDDQDNQKLTIDQDVLCGVTWCRAPQQRPGTLAMSVYRPWVIDADNG